MDIKSISKKKHLLTKINLIDFVLIIIIALTISKNLNQIRGLVFDLSPMLNVKTQFEVYKEITFSPIEELKQKERNFNCSSFPNSFKRGETKIKSILDDIGSMQKEESKLKLIKGLQESYGEMPGLLIFDKTNNIIFTNEGNVLSDIIRNYFPISESENQKNIESNRQSIKETESTDGMNNENSQKSSKNNQYMDKDLLLSYSRQIDKNKMDKILTNLTGVGDNFVDQNLSVKTSNSDYYIIMFRQKNYENHNLEGRKQVILRETKSIVFLGIVLLIILIKIIYNSVRYKFKGVIDQIRQDYVVSIIRNAVTKYRALCKYSRKYKYILSINLLLIILDVFYIYLAFIVDSGQVFLSGVVVMIALVVFFVGKLIGLNIETAIDDIEQGHFDRLKRRSGFGYKGIYLKLANINEGYDKALNESLKNERLKTELITNVSHDLKTPLTSIINYVDILKRPEITEEERKEYLEILDKKTNRLKNLIFDLFEVSKLSSGKIELNKSEIDIIELLNQCLGECSTLYKDKDLEIRFNSKISKLFMNVDGEKMARVFENVIVNAYKYSLEKTRIYVDVEEHDKCWLISFKNISCYEMNFSSEDIFERFARGDKARSSKIEGSGLGMSIVKSIVELHGGKMKVEIDGDMFKVYIYLNKEQQIND
ncbi:sensor histidine kinase [Inconstantimicrobium mannanitabidum]|uniref:Sensor histidine kinase n=1 Tax=Inconstantimicrobium mannanitabidum TaxID=1604901 RepID=A0ACB5RIF3_9CLOT|nr:HAMP domain-containing sensor histidine kinase [Clostridium sp. TW13]GKX68869.1 sensor histidine kinase [Clostridium sp. TW13]